MAIPPELEQAGRDQIAKEITQEKLCLATELKLRLELRGFYQNITGAIVEKLKAEGRIASHQFTFTEEQILPSTYYYQPGLGSPERESLAKKKIDAYRHVYSIMGDKARVGDFLEALIYISLVNIKQTIPSLGITLMRPHDVIDRVNEQEYRFDSYFNMGVGQYGVQVKNTLQMLTTVSNDISTFLSAATSGVARPVLVNRLSSIELKTMMMRHKGRTLDTKTLLICSKDSTMFDRDPFRVLGIESMVEEVPHAIKIEEDEMNGTAFFQGRRYDSFTFDEISESATYNVPPRLLHKMRGLAALLFSTSFLDNATRQLEHRAEALIGGFLITQSLNYLMRSGGRRIDVTELLSRSEGVIRHPLRFQMTRIPRADLIQLLLLRLRQIRDMGIIGESSRQEFVMSPGIQHPEEWLSL